MTELQNTVTTVFLVEIQDAIKNAERLRAQIDQIKAEMVEVRKETQESFDVIAVGFKKAEKGAREYNSAVATANKELNAELKSAQKVQATTLNEITKQKIAASGASLSAEQADLKQLEQIKIQAAKYEEQLEKEKQVRLLAAKKAGSAAELAEIKMTNQQVTAEERAQADFEIQLARQMASIKEAEYQRSLNDQIRARRENLRQQVALNSQEVVETKSLGARLISVFSAIGGALQVAFGLGIYQILSKIVNWFSELGTAGLELSQTMYKLAASVRTLQKQGLEITLAGTVKRLRELRKEFKMFTTQEIAEGISQIQLLTRNFQFNTEQMDEMLDIATKLAILQGKDVAETAKALALFYSSGYAESLQRAGFAVNRLTVEEMAHRMGLEKSYIQLTESERAHAAHNLVLEQSATLNDELAKYLDTLAGKYETASSDIAEASNEIAESLLHVKVAFQELKAWAIEGVSAAIIALDQLAMLAKATAAGVAATRTKWGFIGDPEERAKAYAEAFNRTLREEMDRRGMLLPEDESSMGQKKYPLEDEIVGDDFLNSMDDIEQELLDLVKEKNEDLLKAREDMLDDLGTITDAGLESVLDEWNQYASENYDASVEDQQAMKDALTANLGEYGEITGDALDKILDIWKKYFDKLKDIQTKLDQKIADEELKDLQNKEDLETQYQQKLEDANRKYRENEWKAERDFQEKMRRLKEEFLFDLDDALRERDAKQILRLIRRYNLDKQQLERQGKLDQEERDQKYQDEIEDIKKWRDRRLQELAIEHQRRLDQIALQAERERKQAEVDRERARLEELADLEKARAERATKYDELITEITTKFQTDLLDVMSTAFKSFSDLNTAEAQILQNVFVDAFQAMVDAGEMTVTQMEELANSSLVQVQRLMEARQALMAALGTSLSLNPELKTPGATSGDIPNYAQGGAFVTSQPTRILVGEGGEPELVTITPFSQIPNPSNLAGALPTLGGGGVGNNGGSMRLEVYLSPDLQYRIIDSTLGEVAKIMDGVM